MQRTSRKRTQSIAGAILVGLGAFIFCANLDRAANEFSRLLGTIPQALGMMPAAIVAVSRVMQGYAADHQRFIHCFVLHTLASSWPLALVVVGAVLSRDSFSE